jgi:hypothetical protein
VEVMKYFVGRGFCKQKMYLKISNINLDSANKKKYIMISVIN